MLKGSADGPIKSWTNIDFEDHLYEMSLALIRTP